MEFGSQNPPTDKLEDKLHILLEDVQKLDEKFKSLFSSGSQDKKETFCLRVKNLSDGLEEVTSIWEEEFLNGEIAKSNKHIHFEILPISARIEEYHLPLVLISGENEIDRHIHSRVATRTRNGFKTFPIIFFSNDFFSIREGESFGYIPIIETLEAACSTKSMVFKESDVKTFNIFVKAYTTYLYLSLKTESLLNNLNKQIDLTEKNINLLLNEINSTKNSLCRKLAAISLCRIYKKQWDESQTLLQETSAKWEETENLIVDIRNQYDLHILNIIRNEPIKNSSPVAVRLDLKYQSINQQLNSFLEEISKSDLISAKDYLQKDLESQIGETRKELESKTAELTFIGTFSSGKTTMINTLLGNKHKLHTSKNHNTAVLMEIKSKDINDTNEKYEIIPKDKFTWDLIKPVSFDTKLIKNPFTEETKVLSIIKKETEYEVHLQQLKGEIKKLILNIAKSHKLAINEGDKIKGSANLIKNDSIGGDIQIVPKSEINEIMKIISAQKLNDPCITVLQKSRQKELKNKEALTFLKKLSKCCGEKSQIINMSKLKEVLGEEIDHATIEGNLSLEQRTVILNEKGWIDFCGDPNEKVSIQKEKNQTPFCEQPECYMLSDHLNVYLESEFLQYCSINDTPGFGSLTEEHDACTERFVNKDKSRLLAMITINSKTSDTKLYDFLNFVANIYQNFKRDQMNEVYFMLNCFSNNAPEEKLKSDVKKVTKRICDLGFCKNNIYVCDLRKATENLQEMDKMWGYPSYLAFKKECINKMLEDDLNQKYLSIEDLWGNFFLNNENFIENRIVELNENLQNEEERIQKYKTLITNTKAVKEPFIDKLLQKVHSQYNEFYDLIFSTFTGSKRGAGIFWHHRERKEECKKAIKTISNFVQTPDFQDFGTRIKSIVVRQTSELENASEIFQEHKYNDPNENIFTFSVENLRSKLIAADEYTRAWNKRENTNYYMNQIKEIIERDYKESEKRAKRYFEKISKDFTNQKVGMIETLEKELRDIGNPEVIKNKINLYTSTSDGLKIIKRIFEKKVNFNIIKR